MKLLRQDSGSQVVEFSFVVLPLFAVALLNVDCAWMIFCKGSLQWAVRQGVRFAVTGQTVAGIGQDASIRAVVQQNAFGLLEGDTGLNTISITYFNPATLTTTNQNAGGNIVQISVNNVAVAPLAPLWRSGDPVLISAASSDVMESSPGGIPPKR